MTEFHEEEEDYFCRFTFGQFVSLALLELVALFFVFYLGARYGPDLLGEKRTASEAVPEELIPEGSIPFPTGGAANEVEYTYPLTLTKKEAELPAATPSATESEAGVSETVVAVTPPAPTTPVERRGGYSIQVGSYRKASGAAEKINKWQAKGYDAFMSIGDVPNQGTWYRVRIGNFATRETAKQFLDKLVAKEKVSAIIVRNNS